MAKVVKGRIIEVENKDRKFGALPAYSLMWAEDSTGNDEFPLLFTANDIIQAKARAAANKEDIIAKGWFTDLID